MKKIFIFIGIVLCLFTVFSTGWMIVCFNEFSTLVSYESYTNDSQYVYQTKIDGNYYSDKFVDENGAWSNNDLTNFIKAYSTRGLMALNSFDVQNVDSENKTFTFYDNNQYLAKSYASESNSTIIVETSPANSYASVSTVDFGTLGVDNKISFTQKLYTPGVAYLPTDGMNETGLTASLNYTNQIAEDIVYYNSSAIDITETVLLRFILDNCATTDEALALVDEYDLYLSGNNHFNIIITDSLGQSVIIYTEENDYLGENLLKIITKSIDIETSSTVVDAVSTLNSFSTELNNNYSVIYDQSNKTANYYLFGKTEVQITIQL